MQPVANVLLLQTAASKVQNAIQANAPTHLTANVLSAQNAQAENAIQESASESYSSFSGGDHEISES